MIALVLIAVATSAVAGFLFNEFWSDSAADFLKGYSNVVADLKNDTTFLTSNLRKQGSFEKQIGDKLETEMKTPIDESKRSFDDTSNFERSRKSLMVLVCVLPVMGLAFGLFGGLCMSPWGANALILLGFLSIIASWAGFAVHNMMYRFDSDVCRDISGYALNKTGSAGLTFFINCPKNGTMVAPFNSSFMILKREVGTLNAMQKASNLLGKDMNSIEVFGALDTAPTPKQGVFVKALTVVVKKDIDNIRSQITYQQDSKNLTKAVADSLAAQIDITQTWSSAITKASEMARCMFITEFFAEASKTVCDQTAKGGLYGCVEICFAMGIVMVLGLILGILGEQRFNEMNGEGFKTSGSNDSDPDSAPILSQQDKEYGEPGVPDSMVDSVGKKP